MKSLSLDFKGNIDNNTINFNCEIFYFISYQITEIPLNI